MLGSLARLSAGFGLPDTVDYTARAERAVCLLAEACGLGGDRELERFRTCNKKLRTPPPGAEGADLMAMMNRVIIEIVPVTYELVLAYRDEGDGPAGFGYLTQGGNAVSVAGLQQLLQTALELYLTAGSPEAGAALLVDLFRLAFPDLQALAGYRSTAQALVVCVIPRPEALVLKAYFNTRMYVDGDHRGRVGRMLERAGAGTSRFDELYAALYDQERGARFMGVGADIDGSQRVKLYVRMDTADAFAHLERLGELLQISVDSETLRRNFASEDLAHEMEIALAFRGADPPTLKWTYFFPGKRERPAVRDATSALLVRQGYDPTPFEDCFAALRGEKITNRAFPLHGVGLELPQGERAKVNLYMYPTY